MVENTEIWNLNALCRCCHQDGYFKNLHTSYIYENEKEVYAQMLRDTFNFEIRQPLLEASNSICEVCILRLRDAYKFKKQVQACERKFEIYCKNELASNDAIDSIKVEADFDNDNGADAGGNDYDVELEVDFKDNEDLTKKEEIDFEGLVKVDVQQIKSEVSEDVKTDIRTVIKPEYSDGNQKTKKRVRKKFKTEGKKAKRYDPSLEVHVTTESGTLYSCKICGGSYNEQKQIKKHIQTSHKDSYKCYYCDIVFNSLSVRSKHMRSHTRVSFKCSYCHRSFTSKHTLKMHENTHTKLIRYQCDVCLKEFAYKQTLIVHLRGHYGTKKRCICHICGNSFNDKTNLGSHIKTVHEKQRPFTCDVCPKTFTAKKHLTVHLRTHTGETPYECDHCNKKFITFTAMNLHKQSIHLYSVEGRYVCKVCRKRWTDKNLYLRHLKKAHSGQRPYKCTLCEKDFTCKYSMQRHVIEHNGIKPFSCEQCGAKFKQKGVLKRHVNKLHLAPKVAVTEKCDVCNKNVVDIKKHMLCHSNKRFSCEYCGKSYSEDNVLTRHKKVVHFGIKPHVCEYCDKKYVKVNSLRNHQMKVHKIVSKIENDEDFDSAVAKFSIKNKKGAIKIENGDGNLEDIPFS